MMPISIAAQKEHSPTVATGQPESLASLQEPSAAPKQQGQSVLNLPLPSTGMACGSDDGEISDDGEVSEPSRDGMLTPSPRRDAADNLGSRDTEAKSDAVNRDPPTSQPNLMPDTLTTNLLRALAEETGSRTTTHDAPCGPVQHGAAKADGGVLSLSALLSPALCQASASNPTSSKSEPMISTPSNTSGVRPLPSPCRGENKSSDNSAAEHDVAQSMFDPPSIDHGENTDVQDAGSGPNPLLPSPPPGDTDIFQTDGASADFGIHSPGCTPCSSPVSRFSDIDSLARSLENSPICLASPMSPTTGHGGEGEMPVPPVEQLNETAAPTGTSSEVQERPDPHMATSEALLAAAHSPSATPAAPTIITGPGTPCAAFSEPVSAPAAATMPTNQDDAIAELTRLEKEADTAQLVADSKPDDQDQASQHGSAEPSSVREEQDPSPAVVPPAAPLLVAAAQGAHSSPQHGAAEPSSVREEQDPLPAVALPAAPMLVAAAQGEHSSPQHGAAEPSSVREEQDPLPAVGPPAVPMLVAAAQGAHSSTQHVAAEPSSAGEEQDPSPAVAPAPEAKSAQEATDSASCNLPPCSPAQPSPTSAQDLQGTDAKKTASLERLMGLMQEVGFHSPSSTSSNRSPSHFCALPKAEGDRSRVKSPVHSSPVSQAATPSGASFPGSWTEAAQPREAEPVSSGMTAQESQVNQEIAEFAKELAEMEPIFNQAKRKREEDSSTDGSISVTPQPSPAGSPAVSRCTSVESQRSQQMRHRSQARSSRPTRLPDYGRPQSSCKREYSADRDAAVAHDAVWRGRGPPRWTRHPAKRSKTTRQVAAMPMSEDSESVSSTPSRCTLPDRSRSPARSHRVDGLTRARRPRERSHPLDRRPCLKDREVYLGNITKYESAGVGPVRDGVANCQHEVRLAFEELFNELPEYRERYSSSVNPIKSIKAPAKASGGNRNFIFIEFLDATLASTAVLMSGMKVSGSSVKINRTVDGPRPEEAVPGLDVSPLRDAGKLPYSGGPGAMFMTDVYIGTCLGSRFGDYNEWDLCDAISKAMLESPGVQARAEELFPGMTSFIVGLSIGEGGKYAFASMKNEVLASTLVSLGEIKVYKDLVIRTGWPSTYPDAEKRAPPSLISSEDRAKQMVKSEPLLGEKFDCDVHIGCTRGLDASVLISAMLETLKKIPAYQEEYGEEVNPVQTVRTGRAPFAFARLVDPVLASTFVAVGCMEVSGRLCTLSRPELYKKSASQGVKPLDLTGASVGYNRPVAAPLRCFGPSASRKPPTPPRCPTREERAAAQQQRQEAEGPALIWIGNINWDFMDSRMLEQFLTEQAIEAPIFDVEGGPPITRVAMNHMRGFAFVTLRDKKLGERLIPVFHGASYYGRPLVCRWATHKSNFNAFMRAPQYQHVCPEYVDYGRRDYDDSSAEGRALAVHPMRDWESL